MPDGVADGLGAALGHPGLGWLIAAALVSGLVRGFSGFGTAMIYLPVAGQVLPPLWAILTLTIMDVFGPVPNLPRAWRAAHRGDLARLALGVLLFLPLGLTVLTAIRPETYRYAVSGISLVLLVCLVLGLRWRGTLRPPLVFGVGAMSGFSGGLAGLPGPPVILFYMASPHSPSVIRANTMLHLFLFDWMLMGLIAVRGGMDWTPALIGAMLILPNMAGNVVGAALFDPARAPLYRAAAYGIIAASALAGLPLWD